MMMFFVHYLLKSRGFDPKAVCSAACLGGTCLAMDSNVIKACAANVCALVREINGLIRC